MAQSPISLIKVAVTAGFALPRALWISNIAPIAINPSGVAVAPMLVAVLFKICGIGIF